VGRVMLGRCISKALIQGIVAGPALCAALILSPVSRAESAGKLDTEAAEMAAELIGAPVFAKDGAEVGEVGDIFFDEEGEPRRLRVKAAAYLGLGTRKIDVPKGAFILVRGAVVLEMPAHAVHALPELGERSDEP
jgi:sporulation protein YlmC with PRC-barrel domain